jgi:hypothetical protein
MGRSQRDFFQALLSLFRFPIVLGQQSPWVNFSADPDETGDHLLGEREMRPTEPRDTLHNNHELGLPDNFDLVEIKRVARTSKTLVLNGIYRDMHFRSVDRASTPNGKTGRFRIPSL